MWGITVPVIEDREEPHAILDLIEFGLADVLIHLNLPCNKIAHFAIYLRKGNEGREGEGEKKGRGDICRVKKAPISIKPSQSQLPIESPFALSSQPPLQWLPRPIATAAPHNTPGLHLPALIPSNNSAQTRHIITITTTIPNPNNSSHNTCPSEALLLHLGSNNNSSNSSKRLTAPHCNNSNQTAASIILSPPLLLLRSRTIITNTSNKHSHLRHNKCCRQEQHPMVPGMGFLLPLLP